MQKFPNEIVLNLDELDLDKLKSIQKIYKLQDDDRTIEEIAYQLFRAGLKMTLFDIIGFK
jgi:hypothetical protein